MKPIDPVADGRALTALIDTYGLKGVLLGIADVCAMKARYDERTDMEHVWKSYERVFDRLADEAVPYDPLRSERVIVVD